MLYPTRGYLLAPVNHMYGLQNSIYDYFEKNDSLKYNSLEDYKNNLKFLAAIPEQIRDVEELLREGVREGITYANESIRKTRDQFQRLQVDNATESPFYTQFGEIRTNLPNVSEEDADDVQKQVELIF